MHGLLLQSRAEGPIHDEEKQRLEERRARDDQQHGVEGGPQAADADGDEVAEEAQGRQVLEEYDPKVDQVQLSGRGANHDGGAAGS